MEISLRKITVDDLEKIMNWRTMPEVTKFMYTDPVLNMEMQKKWFKEIEKKSDIYWMLMCDNVDIGVVILLNIDKENKVCGWAHYIGNLDYRGKKIMPLVEYNIYDYVFDVLEFEKLTCELLESNKRALDIHIRCGSTIEEKLPNHVLKNGLSYDAVRVAITKKQWNNIKDKQDYNKILIERQ